MISAKVPKTREGDVAAAILIASGEGTPGDLARSVGNHSPARQAQINMRDAGRAIRRRLVDRGTLREIFENLGYTVDNLVEDIIEATKATKSLVIYDKKAGTRIQQEPDWRARHEAREQYAELSGLTSLPAESDPNKPIIEVSDEILVTLAATVRTRRAHGRDQPRVVASLAEQPTQVDSPAERGHSPTGDDKSPAGGELEVEGC